MVRAEVTEEHSNILLHRLSSVKHLRKVGVKIWLTSANCC